MIGCDWFADCQRKPRTDFDCVNGMDPQAASAVLAFAGVGDCWVHSDCGHWPASDSFDEVEEATMEASLRDDKQSPARMKRKTRYICQTSQSTVTLQS